MRCTGAHDQRSRGCSEECCSGHARPLRAPRRTHRSAHCSIISRLTRAFSSGGDGDVAARLAAAGDLTGAEQVSMAHAAGTPATSAAGATGWRAATDGVPLPAPCIPPPPAPNWRRVMSAAAAAAAQGRAVVDSSAAATSEACTAPLSAACTSVRRASGGGGGHAAGSVGVLAAAATLQSWWRQQRGGRGTGSGACARVEVRRVQRSFASVPLSSLAHSAAGSSIVCASCSSSSLSSDVARVHACPIQRGVSVVACAAEGAAVCTCAVGTHHAAPTAAPTASALLAAPRSVVACAVESAAGLHVRCWQ